MTALNRLRAALIGADADNLFDIGDEDFAVPDFSRLGGMSDRLDRALRPVVGENDFQFHLGQKIDGIFAATINLGVAFLTTKSSDFTQGHSFDPDLGERLFHGLHLEGLDDRLDFFHARILEPAD